MRVPDRESDAAAGLGQRRHRRGDRAACRRRGGCDALQISGAARPQRDVAQRRPVGLVQRQDMGVGSRCPEVNRIARPVRHRQAPDAHEEVLGCIDIGNVQCNAAQSGNTGRCHRYDPRSLPDYENRHLAKRAIAPKAPGNRPGQDDPIGSGGHQRWTRGPNETAPVCFTSRGSWVGTIHRVSGARGPARRLRCSGRARRRLARRRRQRGQARRPRCAVQDGRSPRGFGRQRACRRGRPRRQAGVRAATRSTTAGRETSTLASIRCTTRSRSRRASPRSPSGSR